MTQRYRYTNDDIEFLKINYPNGNWDKIFERFPFTTKNKIYSVCNKHGIKSDYDRTKSIANLRSKRWTPDEDDILQNYYNKISIREIMSLLPSRSYDSIVQRASRLGIPSLFKEQQLYSAQEVDYIKNNWKTKSDWQLSIELSRTARSIKWMRSNLGLFRQDPDRDLSYDDLNKYLRGNIYDWKIKSMESCNYQCILTGSKDFAIHHLYNFQYILETFLSTHDFHIFEDINKYSKEELNGLLETFVDYHNTFPLGVCVSKELHKLFHHCYGKSFNTPEQWNEFTRNYKKGKYNH